MSNDLHSPPRPEENTVTSVAAESRREIRMLQASIAILVCLRLWMMATNPLTDTTEARYGELARVTAEGGFWLMPHMTPTEPFFAKPPLSTWFAAGSWKFLGNNEFALRFPSFVMCLVTTWLVLAAARDMGIGHLGRWMIVAMLTTAPIFFVSAGAVMTDATQLAVVIGAMLVAWRALREPECRRWRLLFWTLLGVATLAKGLATLALIGLPLIAYILFGEGLALVFRRLWDPLGLVAGAVVCLAWYVPAELAYPGFLNYFLIGEHFQRYLQPGWAGDRYGHAHHTSLGMIWVFWIIGTGLWLPVFLREARQLVRRDRSEPVSMSQRWLWCWVLAPLVFFTISRNIIMTYTLTAIPPFALIVGRWAEANQGRLRRSAAPFALGLAMIGSIVGVTWLPGRLDVRSARQLVAVAKSLKPEATIFVRGIYPFSSNFYTLGTAQRIDDKESLAAALNQPGALLLIPESEKDAVIGRGHLRVVATASYAVLLEVVRPEESTR